MHGLYLLFLCGVWRIFLCRASEAFEILNRLCMSDYTPARLKHERGAHAICEDGPQSTVKECINNLQREFSLCCVSVVSHYAYMAQGGGRTVVGNSVEVTCIW